MNRLNDADFYRRRAAQATAMADAATVPGIQRIHRDMAAQYAALAEPDPTNPARSTLSLSF